MHTIYRRPTFKCIVKRLRFRVFKEIANSISPHVRITLIANSIIANWGEKFAFTFIASSHLYVGLRHILTGQIFTTFTNGSQTLVKVAVQPCELHKLSQQTNINTCSSSSSKFSCGNSGTVLKLQDCSF